MGATKNIHLGSSGNFPERSDGDYGLDSTATRCTTLGISEENKKIEEKEEYSNDTHLRKITIMVFEKRKN